MKISRKLSHALVILWRPFLGMAKAIIDWEKGMVEFKIELPISHLMKYLKDINEDVCLLSLVEEDNFSFDIY